MILEQLQTSSIKCCTKSELNVLCDELRQTIYQTVLHCGGHLASNLGAIESTVALCYVFDFPKDKIIFDVGHQCYAYKLLTGRLKNFSTLRQAGGISGFPKRTESEYDAYDTGHAGTSISAGLGYAKARDLLEQNHNVIAYIGDGSFNNGLVYEALNSLKILNTNILIILNDNGMSISPTVGGMHDILTQIKSQSKEENIRLLQSFGLTYLGIKDCNNVEQMIDALEEAKGLLATKSVLLHVTTQKGKGYEFSEEHPVNTHGVSPVGSVKDKEYSEVLGETLCQLAKQEDKLAVVSAAMKDALGLAEFFKNFPERAFDVGICEENAAVLCASMATGGLKPYYAIYSTFLQRAFDEIVHDICMQDLPVTFCIDRAGISGADGETHQGVFDLSYLSFIPNLAIATPKDTDEMKKLLQFSLHYQHPLAIRYPRAGKVVFPTTQEEIQLGKWEYIHKTDCANVTVLATGERSIIVAMKVLNELKKDNKEFDIVNARFVKPLDEVLLQNLQSKYVITIEDNMLAGGFGSIINTYAITREKDWQIKNFAYEDRFIPQGNIQDLQAKYGVNCKEIQAYVEKILK